MSLSDYNVSLRLTQLMKEFLRNTASSLSTVPLKNLLILCEPIHDVQQLLESEIQALAEKEQHNKEELLKKQHTNKQEAQDIKDVRDIPRQQAELEQQQAQFKTELQQSRKQKREYDEKEGLLAVHITLLQQNLNSITRHPFNTANTHSHPTTHTHHDPFYISKTHELETDIRKNEQIHRNIKKDVASIQEKIIRYGDSIEKIGKQLHELNRKYNECQERFNAREKNMSLQHTLSAEEYALLNANIHQSNISIAKISRSLINTATQSNYDEFIKQILLECSTNEELVSLARLMQEYRALTTQQKDLQNQHATHKTYLQKNKSKREELTTRLYVLESRQTDLKEKKIQLDDKIKEEERHRSTANNNVWRSLTATLSLVAISAASFLLYGIAIWLGFAAVLPALLPEILSIGMLACLIIPGVITGIYGLIEFYHCDQLGEAMRDQEKIMKQFKENDIEKVTTYSRTIPEHDKALNELEQKLNQTEEHIAAVTHAMEEHMNKAKSIVYPSDATAPHTVSNNASMFFATTLPVAILVATDQEYMKQNDTTSSAPPASPHG